MASNGDIYVSDGYGNAFVHHLSPTGEHISTWGGPGVGPSEFRLPHGVWMASWRGQETVYVCDRENSRIQLFSLDGEYLGKVPGVRRPTDIVVDGDGMRYVSELLSRVTILDEDDHAIAHIGGEELREPGQFVAPHSVWLDSEGSLYVTEVLEGSGCRSSSGCARFGTWDALARTSYDPANTPSGHDLAVHRAGLTTVLVWCGCQ